MKMQKRHRVKSLGGKTIKCAGSRSVGRPWKSWIDTVKECLKKIGLDVRQARRMVQDRSEWRRFVRGNA